MESKFIHVAAVVLRVDEPLTNESGRRHVAAARAGGGHGSMMRTRQHGGIYICNPFSAQVSEG